ncbi:hypothetical protein J1614_003734 [Plenodomus biglobosus]|nr:hypothetical protein J1614_003734 [Plenodomus biglobosus]
MGFLSNLVSEFTHSGQLQGQQGQGQYGGGQQYGNSQQQYGGGQQEYGGPPQHSSQSPPPVSLPWIAEWDGRDSRWLFVNQQTGERTFTYPGPGYAQQQGNYGSPQNGYGNNSSGYSNQGAYGQQSYNPTDSGHQQDQKENGGNGWKYAAAGVAGVAGGALLMHEGENIKDDLERDEYRVENRVDEFGNDISNLPETAANWTGEQVGRAENFGDRVDQRFDNAVDDVENFPENAAQWTGEKVQEVEDVPQDIENRWDNAVDDVDQFGDRMGDAYDEGRDEQRYEDDARDDDY